jgi:hypothetical protein
VAYPNEKKLKKMTKSRSKQNKNVLPKHIKKKYNEKRLEDTIKMILSLWNLEMLFEPITFFLSWPRSVACIMCL